MARGRPVAGVVLSDSDRFELNVWCRRRKTALALRARIILDCAEGPDNRRIAARHRVAQQTVSDWRGRFSRLGLDGLTIVPSPYCHCRLAYRSAARRTTSGTVRPRCLWHSILQRAG